MTRHRRRRAPPIAPNAWSTPPIDGRAITWEHPGKIWTEKDRIESETTHAKRDQTTYLRGMLLGSGGWSHVYKVRRVADGRILAGKSCRTLRLLRREAQILKSLNHEHIVKFVDWDEKVGLPDDILLVTELCEGGTLQARIDATSRGLPGCEVLDVLTQIASALDYIHASGLIHSDVKPRNILLRSLAPLHAVLGDCADIKHAHNLPPGPSKGTSAYFSPEILRFNRCCGTADDMWALGVTMLGLIGQWPQMLYTNEGVRHYAKLCHDHAVKLKELNPEDELVEGLLVRLLAWNAKYRLNAAECDKTARRLRDSGQWGNEKVKIHTPDDFKPVSFW